MKTNNKEAKILLLKHKGVGFSFVQERFGSNSDELTNRDNILELDFNDLYEVNLLIDALERFKECCEDAMGYWEVT